MTDAVDQGARTPPDGHRSNARPALVEAAYEQFATNGYDATTVSGIAAHAGVTTGAVYAHFAGKLELLLETVGLAPVEDLMRSFSDLAALPWSEAVRQLSAEMATEPDRRTVLLLDVIVAGRRNPEIARILRDGLGNYLDGMHAATRAGSASGLIDPVLSAADLTRVLALLSLGMIIFAALGQDGPSEQGFETVIDRLMQSPGRAAGDRSRLQRVQDRSREAKHARADQVAAVIDAVDEGYSFRQVAEAAGMSHERVRQLVRAGRP